MSNFFDHDLPFEFKDTNGFQLTWWGDRTQGIDGHDGYDWRMPEGTPLLAVADGVVTFVQTRNDPFECPPLGRIVTDGHNVQIEHTAPNGERFRSSYSHLSRIDVQVGQRMLAGQQIGLSGNTGCSTAPHLHFQALRLTTARTGRFTRIDPYGWEGERADPWAEHPEGAQSIWLWKEGQAPLIYREIRLSPNPNPGDTARVTITVFRWMGWKDDANPNNEFVQLEVDPRFLPEGVLDLTGFRLRNNSGQAFDFPSSFSIRRDRPVRVFTGSGTNTEVELYWGLANDVWDNSSDCAHLIRPDGRAMYRLRHGAAPCA